jgi:hypothetical protein
MWDVLTISHAFFYTYLIYGLCFSVAGSLTPPWWLQMCHLDFWDEIGKVLCHFRVASLEPLEFSLLQRNPFLPGSHQALKPAGVFIFNSDEHAASPPPNLVFKHLVPSWWQFGENYVVQPLPGLDLDITVSSSVYFMLVAKDVITRLPAPAIAPATCDHASPP